MHRPKLRNAVLLASAILAAFTTLNSCAGPAKRLPAAELHQCVASGGFESRSPFGLPFCQFRYGDGGKICSDKTDCQGRCLVDIEGGPSDPVPKPGSPAQGRCEAVKSTFGCFAKVEAGKIDSEGAICED